MIGDYLFILLQLFVMGLFVWIASSTHGSEDFAMGSLLALAISAILLGVFRYGHWGQIGILVLYCVFSLWFFAQRSFPVAMDVLLREEMHEPPVIRLWTNNPWILDPWSVAIYRRRLARGNHTPTEELYRRRTVPGGSV